MSKPTMTTCKACGAEIANSAKACPKCGAKNKKKHPVLLGILIAIVVIILISAIFGSSDTSSQPEKVGEVTPPVETSNGPEKEPVKTEFGVGEIVELNDILVTFKGVTENNGSQFLAPADGNKFVVCEFEIENKSSGDIAVSSMMSFEAYVDDYSTSLSITAMTSVDTPQLDGTVAAGKKMKGVVGYEVPADWSNIEIRFTPNFWTGKDITFIYDK